MGVPETLGYPRLFTASLFFNTHERKSECEAQGDGGREASEASQTKNRESVDMFQKKWAN